METGTLILFVVGLGLIALGAEWFVRGASRLAVVAGVSPLVIGLTVVAYGTSAPELAVSVQASLEGSSDISLGNVVGSNIYNILLILGLSAAVAPLTVSRQLIRLDVPLMIGVSVLVLVMGLDGKIGRWEGLALVAGAAWYTVWSIRKSRREMRANADPLAEPAVPGSFVSRWLVPAGFILIGVAMLVLGADWVKDGAVAMARYFGVSELIIALTIVAIGTSLPEIATSVAAGIRGERDIAVGNAVGSNLFNLLLVLGAAAIVSQDGVAVPPVALRFDLPIMIAVAIFCMPIFMSGGGISRGEGAMFLLYYVAYTIFLIIKAGNHDALTLWDTATLVFLVPPVVLVIVHLARRFHRTTA